MINFLKALSFIEFILSIVLMMVFFGEKRDAYMYAAASCFTSGVLTAFGAEVLSILTESRDYLARLVGERQAPSEPAQSLPYRGFNRA